MSTAKEELAPIERMILEVRGQRVILAAELARIYGVETRTLNQAVKRNIEKFPPDFMFQLTRDEATALSRSRSQFVILKRGTNVKYLPYAFTEQGVAMLSSVLRSRRAVQVNIAIMRAFVRLRELLATHKGLARKLEELEEKYDAQFAVVFQAIRQLMAPTPEPEKPKTPIGFAVGESEPVYRRRRRAAVPRA